MTAAIRRAAQDRLGTELAPRKDSNMINRLIANFLSDVTERADGPTITAEKFTQIRDALTVAYNVYVLNFGDPHMTKFAYESFAHPIGNLTNFANHIRRTKVTPGEKDPDLEPVTDPVPDKPKRRTYMVTINGIIHAVTDYGPALLAYEDIVYMAFRSKYRRPTVAWKDDQGHGCLPSDKSLFVHDDSMKIEAVETNNA